IDAPRPGSGTRRRRTRDGDHAPAPKPGLVHHSDQGSQGGFNWSLQRSRLEGCDGKAGGGDARVEGSGGRRAPGAPALRRDVERVFWREVAKGLTSEDAALAVGASEAAGSRWFRERGGVPTFVLVPLSGRYLCFEERVQIALMRARGARVWAI